MVSILSKHSSGQACRLQKSIGGISFFLAWIFPIIILAITDFGRGLFFHDQPAWIFLAVPNLLCLAYAALSADNIKAFFTRKTLYGYIPVLIILALAMGTFPYGIKMFDRQYFICGCLFLCLLMFLLQDKAILSYLRWIGIYGMGFCFLYMAALLLYYGIIGFSTYGSGHQELIFDFTAIAFGAHSLSRAGDTKTRILDYLWIGMIFLTLLFDLFVTLSRSFFPVTFLLLVAAIIQAIGSGIPLRSKKLSIFLLICLVGLNSVPVLDYAGVLRDRLYQYTDKAFGKTWGPYDPTSRENINYNWYRYIVQNGKFIGSSYERTMYYVPHHVALYLFYPERPFFDPYEVKRFFPKYYVPEATPKIPADNVKNTHPPARMPMNSREYDGFNHEVQRFLTAIGFDYRPLMAYKKPQQYVYAAPHDGWLEMVVMHGWLYAAIVLATLSGLLVYFVFYGWANPAVFFNIIFLADLIFICQVTTGLNLSRNPLAWIPLLWVLFSCYRQKERKPITPQ